MTRLIFLFILIYAGWKFAQSVTETGGSSAFPGSSGPATEALETAAGDRKQVVLITGTTWCGPCQALEREVIQSGAWKEFTAKEISFTVHDVPRDTSRMTPAMREALERFQVRGFPTMLVIDGNGRVLSRQVGVAGGVEQYKSWIRGT